MRKLGREGKGIKGRGREGRGGGLRGRERKERKDLGLRGNEGDV